MITESLMDFHDPITQNQRIPKHSWSRILHKVLAPFTVNESPCKAQLKTSVGQLQSFVAPGTTKPFAHVWLPSAFRGDEPSGMDSPPSWTPTVLDVMGKPGKGTAESGQAHSFSWKAPPFCVIKNTPLDWPRREFPILEHYILRLFIKHRVSRELCIIAVVSMSNSSSVKLFFTNIQSHKTFRDSLLSRNVIHHSTHTGHDSFGLVFIIMSLILATWLSLIHLDWICLQNSCMG